MQAATWFLLAIMTMFTIGMIIHDPNEAHRPPLLRETPQVQVLAVSQIVV